jgi:hypothetical protein
VLFLLSIVQLIDSLQALLLFSTELLVESRKGAQLRLFDAKRGQLRAPFHNALPLRPPVSQGGTPQPLTSQGSDICPPPTFVPTSGPRNVLMAPPAAAAIKPSSEMAWRVSQNTMYGTLGAQMALTAAESQHLGEGLRSRNSGGRNLTTGGTPTSPSGASSGLKISSLGKK